MAELWPGLGGVAAMMSWKISRSVGREIARHMTSITADSSGPGPGTLTAARPPW